MKKTSIYIEPEVDVALTRRAAQLGTSKAKVIREALRAAAADSLAVKPRGRGAFAGPGDLARQADHYLQESGFGEK